MNCELLATCSALGYLEGDTYHKEPDCLGGYLSEETGKKKKNLLELSSVNFSSHVCKKHLGLGGASSGDACSVCSVPEESVKDLIRYLRHEDETRDVRQQLGAAQILQSDLLPLLTQHRQDKALFDAVIRWLLPTLVHFHPVPVFAV